MVSTPAGIVHSKLVRFTLLGMFIVPCFLYILLFNHNYHFVSHYFQVDVDPLESHNEWIAVPECNCSRKNHYYVEGQAKRKSFRLASSCSDPGTFFQPSQKVVSYSLYLPKCTPSNKCTGPKSFYLEGILENLRTMRLHYPTYTMRLYTDVRIDAQFCSIICNNSDFFWCDIRASPMYPNQDLSQVFFMIWRFLPLGDPTVDHFLSRDLDSILTEREAAVVADWLSLPEKKAIHIMRDHKHHNFPILGGTWGASNSLFEGSGNLTALSLLTSMLNHGMNPLRQRKGFDQEVLVSNVFNPLRKEIVAYDSYSCKKWASTLIRPFPIKRKNNSTDFVGNVDLGRQVYRLEKCPVECRPAHGKDWEWC